MKKIFPTKFIPLFLNGLFVGALLLLSLFVSWKNLVPGTLLSGWDNLHSEFNLSLNLHRALSSVWQEYQGLGLLGGMAHAADLPRVLVLMLFAIVVPLNYLRYVWTFLMLAIGPLGTYFLVSKALLKGNDSFGKSLAGFVAGCFYLLNIATVQYFYTPYETFVSFFGLMPWLMFSSLSYLKDGGRRNLVLLLIISFLAAPAFYVQTMYVVFLMLLALFVIETLIRKKKEGMVRSLKLGIVILASSAFFLIPSLYFTLSQSDVVSSSKINSIATVETQLFNEARGDIKSIVQLKGFWFDYTDLNEEGEYGYLMNDWRENFNKKNTEYFSYILFLMAFFGLVVALFKREVIWRFPGVVLLIFFVFMLATTNAPTGTIFNLLSERVPLFSQVFRSIFTKVSVALALIMAVGLGYLVFIIASFKGYLKLISIVPAIIAILFSVYLVRPVFDGKLIMEQGRVEMPGVYFELFEFLESQPESARIALFPTPNFWGWNFYEWGYRGSGFVWYGIRQPVIDRAFDVWSSNNEEFYEQISTAIAINDSGLIRQILEKYNVSFVLFDESVIIPSQDKSVLKNEEVKKLISDTGAEIIWEKEHLAIYDLGKDDLAKGILPLNNGSYIRGVVPKKKLDLAYLHSGGYINYSISPEENIVYPFDRLFSEDIGEVSYSEETESGYWIKFNSENFKEGQKLIAPALPRGNSFPVKAKLILNEDQLLINFSPNIYLSFSEVSYPKLPDISVPLASVVGRGLVSINGNIVEVINGGSVEVSLNLKVGEPVEVFLFDTELEKVHKLEENFLEKKIEKCWTREGEEGLLEIDRKDYIAIETKDAAGCFAFKLGSIESKGKGLMIVTLPYRSNQGSKPHFCVLAEGGDYKCENEEVFYNTYPSEEWSEVERKLVLDSSKVYWIDIAARPPDPVGEGWTIDYKEPKAISYTAVASRLLNSDEIWTEFEKEFVSKVIATDDPYVQIYSIYQEIDFAKGGMGKPRNCDALERGNIEKNRTQYSVEYGAYNSAAVCDYVPLSRAATNNSYLIRFTGENISGRSMKFYLYNKANSRNDTEVLLNEGLFDRSFSVLKWENIKPADYVLNVETRSFGNASVNRLNEVGLYQVNINWLGEWKIIPEKGEHFIKEALIIKDVRKVGTWQYSANVEGVSDIGIINLPQGYDKGWLGYQLKTNTNSPLSKLAYFAPWFFGDRMEHVEVNGWSNGWIVNNTTKDNQIPDIEVVLIFWPQYLQFVGFGILVITASALIFWPAKKIRRIKFPAEKLEHRDIMKD